MYKVYVNNNDGKGWVRGFKRTYDSQAEATKVAASRFKRFWVV